MQWSDGWSTWSALCPSAALQTPLVHPVARMRVRDAGSVDAPKKGGALAVQQ